MTSPLSFMHVRLLPWILAGWAAFASTLAAAITSPKEHFGFAIGDDYHLANYTQTEAYFKKLAAESDRVRLVDMGRTEEGRTQWMLVITDPENLRALEQHRATSARLARAEGLTEAEARALAAGGKAVVWIDGGLHSTETVGTHQLIETAWQLASATDPETRRILRDVIVLCAHANPDGQELVSNWYMREPVPEKRVTSTTPRLYQKYIGHDNNRDFFHVSQRESANINRQLYLEWFPQIVYNHHQTGPVGTVMFVPPFRDPFNYNYDPLVVVGVQTLGTAIQSRFLEEGKPGATSRSGANYSTWFNGSLRTTSYFHNMIGLLSEIIGSPTPMRIPFVARRQLPSSDLTAPVAPQEWRYRQSIDYSVSANRAVLDYASRQRDTLLYNIYRMGRNSIERGSRDSWTPRPSRLDEVQRLAAAESAASPADESAEGDEPPPASSLRIAPKFYEKLYQPEWRDPRGYIVPADQPDFPTAVKFINSLVKTGIAIHRATADFSVAGKRHPAGSYIVLTAQAFRPHILDMFEPQDHPNDFKFEGGPPNRPYDVAGYTLAFQMGVKFERVLEAFDGPFERLPYGELQSPPPGAIAGSGAGFLVSHQANDALILVNRLLKVGAAVFQLKDVPEGRSEMGRGALYIPDEGPARAIVERTARDLGLPVSAVAAKPAGECLRLAPVRIALWDRYGGSMPSGWNRWLLEQFEFPFDVIFAPRIDAGELREKFDVIILPNGAIPALGAKVSTMVRPRNLPPEFDGWIGRLTAAKSVPPLQAFLDAGGTIITLGSSTNLAYHLGLPLEDALVETTASGKRQPLPSEKFFVPGSIVSATLDVEAPVAWGLERTIDLTFDRSPVFRLKDRPITTSIKPLAWFSTAAPLKSGWAWGQHYLKDGVIAAEASVGRGRLYLFGADVTFRSQTHGTFKLLFNALLLSTAQSVAP